MGAQGSNAVGALAADKPPMLSWRDWSVMNPKSIGELAFVSSSKVMGLNESGCTFGLVIAKHCSRAEV